MVEEDPQGERKTTFGDKLQVETFADGSKKVIQASGKMRYLPPPHISQVAVTELKKNYQKPEEQE